MKYTQAKTFNAELFFNICKELATKEVSYETSFKLVKSYLENENFIIEQQDKLEPRLAYFIECMLEDDNEHYQCKLFNDIFIREIKDDVIFSNDDNENVGTEYNPLTQTMN